MFNTYAEPCDAVLNDSNDLIESGFKGGMRPPTAPQPDFTPSLYIFSHEFD